jgi:hypothetical protein
MTADEYRQELVKLDVEQRRSLYEQICKGGHMTVDGMVATFVNLPEVEAIAVRWFRKHKPEFQLKTQAELTQEANIRSADVAEENLTVGRKSLRAANRANVIALVALAVSIIAATIAAIALLR